MQLPKTTFKDWAILIGAIILIPILLGFIFSSVIELFKLGWNVW